MPAPTPVLATFGSRTGGVPVRSFAPSAMPSGGRRGLILGTFDVLRTPQLELLDEATKTCDTVTVGVLDRTASDPVAPVGQVVNSLADRLLVASHLRGVDQVVDVDDLDPVALAARFDVVYLDETVGMEGNERSHELAERVEIVDSRAAGTPHLHVVPVPVVRPDGELVVGYIPGAWDTLHAGHIAILDRARALCDRLVVGVADDATLLAAKGHLPLVPHDERLAVVAALSMADEVVTDVSSDKTVAWRRHRFDVLFKGDDWQGTPKGDRLERDMGAVGARLVYLPYTRRISSTRIRRALDALSA